MKSRLCFKGPIDDRQGGAAAAPNGFWVLPPFWGVCVGDRVSGVGKLCVGHVHVVGHNNSECTRRYAPIQVERGVRCLFLCSLKMELNILPLKTKPQFNGCGPRGETEIYLRELVEKLEKRYLLVLGCRRRCSILHTGIYCLGKN